MSEDAELQAKIAALAGHINQRKQQQPPPAANGRQQAIRNHAPHIHRGHGRWSPYPRGGRGGRAGFQHVPNRSLVLNATPTTPSPASEPETANNEATANQTAASDAFISTRRPGMNQLINRDAFDREQKQKIEHNDRTRVVKKQKTDRDERSRLSQYTLTQTTREIIVDGIRFQLREDGSKLIRVSGKRAPITKLGNVRGLLNVAEDNFAKETPRKAAIADVEFFRTKSGNLVRANALKDASRYYLTVRPQKHGACSPAARTRLQTRRTTTLCEDFTKHGTHTFHRRLDHWHPKTRAYRYLPAGKCRSSLTHGLGSCPRGPMCRFAHDPNKVVACPKFLKSTCPRGDDCDLSHTPTYSNTPACTHFLRGNCTNDACRYPHVHVSPTAPVCAAFARVGYCDNPSCDKRHVFECPDYANTGYCAKATSGRCSLPHPDHAATLRKAAARQARMDFDNESDLSSDEENQENMLGMEDVDSDDVEDMTDVQFNDHALTQQQDYVAFS